MNISQHRLMQDVSTRWNSTYFMFERLLEQRWAIYAVIHNDHITSADSRHLYLKEDQWNLLQQMVTALKPLQVATTALCEAKAVSISLIYPVISGLIKKHLIVDDNDLPPVKSFKRTVVGAAFLSRQPQHCYQCPSASSSSGSSLSPTKVFE